MAALQQAMLMISRASSPPATGIIFTDLGAVLPYSAAWYQPSYDGTNFLGLNGSNGTTSPDKVTWTARGARPFVTDSVAGDGIGTFVAYFSNGTGDNAVYVSVDHGATWSTVTKGGPPNFSSLSIAWNGNHFCAVGDGEVTVTDQNGPTLAWVQHAAALPTGGGTWRSVAGNGGVFCAIGDGGYSATSTDGITWSAKFAMPAAHEWKLCQGPNGSGLTTMPFFLAVDQTSGEVAKSLDGQSWTHLTTLALGGRSNLAWNGVSFIILAEAGTAAFATTDGVTWATGTQPGSLSKLRAASNGDGVNFLCLSNTAVNHAWNAEITY